ncbi:MAG: DUF3618 domain-containing protein [Chloroflexota bacterium]
MGEKPDEIERTIVDLRRETDTIVDELRHRANVPYVARDVAGRVGHRAETVASGVSRRAELFAGELAETMPEPARSHPVIVAGAAAGLVGSLGAYTIARLARGREETLPEKANHRLQDTLHLVRDSANRYGHDLRQTAQALQSGQQVRVDFMKQEPSMLKRLAWIGLVSVMSALGSMLFKRLTTNVWKGTMHEEPPRH